VKAQRTVALAENPVDDGAMIMGALIDAPKRWMNGWCRDDAKQGAILRDGVFS
jgi:hypothetical protein